MPDHYFFHSFPRPIPDESHASLIERGLKILKSIKEIGLVLAPETISWLKPIQGGGHQTILVHQCRISFTELSRDQLPLHGTKFGPYALEFDIDALRRLGALPVIYMPQAVGSDRAFSSIGSLIVATLREAKYTIEKLRELQQFSDDDWWASNMPPGATHISPNMMVQLQNTDEHGNVVARYPIPKAQLEGVARYLTYRNAPLDLQIGALSLMQNLFYPTDDEHNDELLTYYRQREWRIVNGLAASNVSQCRQLSVDEKALISQINSHFWEREIPWVKQNMKRIDAAYVLDMNNAGVPADELISKVIVPSAVFDAAREMIGNKVIAANELPSSEP